MKEMVCIRCPIGCRLTIRREGEELQVSGNGCPRGREYAVTEMTRPVRTFSVAVRVAGGDRGAVAVRVSKPVEKRYIQDIARIARTLLISAPVSVGQIVVKNVCGSGADLVAIAAVGCEKTL